MPSRLSGSACRSDRMTVAAEAAQRGSADVASGPSRRQQRTTVDLFEQRAPTHRTHIRDHPAAPVASRHIALVAPLRPPSSPWRVLGHRSSASRVNLFFILFRHTGVRCPIVLLDPTASYSVPPPRY
jgi:hypothetical protein